MKPTPPKAPALAMTLSSRRKVFLLTLLSENVVEMARAWPASSCWVVETAAPADEEVAADGGHDHREGDEHEDGYGEAASHPNR